MHNFVLHSNESACRKSGRLGLGQFKEGKSYKWFTQIYYAIRKFQAVSSPLLGSTRLLSLPGNTSTELCHIGLFYKNTVRFSSWEPTKIIQLPSSDLTEIFTSLISSSRCQSVSDPQDVKLKERKRHNVLSRHTTLTAKFDPYKLPGKLKTSCTNLQVQFIQSIWYTLFWRGYLVPLKSIFWSEFNNSCMKLSEFKVPFSVWYILTINLYCWASLSNVIFT